MDYLARGRTWGERSVIMPPDAIPWNRSTARIVATQNVESAVALHEIVPDRCNGLRISHIYGAMDNSANQRHSLRVNVRFGDLRATGATPGIPGIFTATIAILGGAPFFPVYWVLPSGSEFDVTLLQNFVAAPLLMVYLTGWYF